MWRRNVLIFHAGALGDFVLTWPLTVALARLYPQSRIFTVTHADKGRLAQAALGVESADIEAGWHALHAGAPLPERAAKLLAGAHTIVSFVSMPGDAFTAGLAAANPEATLIALRPTPDDTCQEHATTFHLSQLQAWPTVRTALEQLLASTIARGLGRTPRRGDRVLLHPGGGSPAKCWPLERFLELGQALATDGPVGAAIGEVELERWTSADLRRLEGAIPTTRCAGYLELWRALEGVKLFIGNDSGPAHLAGILGVPTLALFGPTSERVWRPLGPRVTTLRRQPLNELSVARVLDAARQAGGAPADPANVDGPAGHF